MTPLMDLLEAGASSEASVHFLPEGKSYRYSELWKQSEQVAFYLRARIGSGGAVASVLTNTAACAPNVFGIWRSGNDLVSLPHPGRGTSIERYQAQIEMMLSMSNVSLLLVDSRFLPLIPELSVPVVAYDETLKGGPTTDATGSGDLIQFTSGSVGTPKGVVLSQEAVAENILSLIEVVEPTPGDNTCSWLPMSHDMGFIGMFLTPMVCTSPNIVGIGHVSLIDPEYFLANPQIWLDTCSETRATVTTVPNFAMELVSRGRSLHRSDLDLSSLRIAITGAERVSADTLARFSSAFADAKLKPEVLCPAYGLAENTLAVTIVRPKDHWQSIRVDAEALGDDRIELATGDRPAQEYVSNGVAMPRVGVRIDAEDGQVGEVQIKSASMLSSYRGADLQLTDDGWFATRDLGFLVDDELYLVGRNDDTIIVGGKNYYAPDVEHALDHPSVRKGNIAAIPNETGYQLVMEPAKQLDTPELEAVCREMAVTAGKEVGIRPSGVTIVPRGSLFKTPSGKLQRPLIRRAMNSGELVPLASVSFGGIK